MNKIEAATQIIRDSDGHIQPFLDFAAALNRSKVGAFDAYVQDEQAKRDEKMVQDYCEAHKLEAESLTDEERSDIIEQETAAYNDDYYGGDMYETDLKEHGTW